MIESHSNCVVENIVKFIDAKDSEEENEGDLMMIDSIIIVSWMNL